MPKSERYRLSKKVHPLLKTRGVPGTHEIQLGIDTINSLVSQKNKETRIPMFSKKYDDRLSRSDWPIFYGTPNVIIFEGWCVGAKSENSITLKRTINSMEKLEDQRQIWRKYVNQQLKTKYKNLYSQLNCLIYLNKCLFPSRIAMRPIGDFATFFPFLTIFFPLATVFGIFFATLCPIFLPVLLLETCVAPFDICFAPRTVWPFDTFFPH